MPSPVPPPYPSGCSVTPELSVSLCHIRFKPVLLSTVRFCPPCPVCCDPLRAPPHSTPRGALPSSTFSDFPLTPCIFPSVQTLTCFPTLKPSSPPMVSCRQSRTCTRSRPVRPRRPFYPCCPPHVFYHTPPMVHLADLRAGRTGQQE